MEAPGQEATAVLVGWTSLDRPNRPFAGLAELLANDRNVEIV